MVSEQQCVEQDFRGLPKTEYRLIRNTGEQKTRGVLLTVAHQAGLDSRLPKYRLEGNVRVRISTPNTVTACAAESEKRTLYSYPDCANFSPAVVVPVADGTNNRSTQTLTVFSGFTNAEQRGMDTPRSNEPKIGSLENFRDFNAEKNLSEKAQKYIYESKRPSTRRVYESRQRLYCRWCSERDINPTTASLKEISDFIIFLHESRNFKTSTLTGYRTAIASIHKGWYNSSVSNNTILSKLIKGIFHSNPYSKKLLPSWDLPLVLNALTKPPFEPLRAIDLKFLTWKTVFLVALASAARVSEIHALSTNFTCLRHEVAGIRLCPNMKFLAKNQKLEKAWSPWFIPDFRRCSRNAKDLVLCPCRCLREYLKRTLNLRKNNEALFITYQEGYNKPASKNSIARWILSTIKYAYSNSSLPYPLECGAHDTRRLATSWALFNGASLKDIIQAAHWSSDSMFASVYLKDVSQDEGNFAKASILGSIKDRSQQ